ncbi:MAG: DNA/RNA non-specific endonuclease, partial [Vicinamibacteria bacterium]
LQAQVDFKEEYRAPDAFEVGVKEILHLEENADYLPDMALVRLEPNEQLPPPIRLAHDGPRFQEDVVVIGYPAQDSRNDYFVMHGLYKGIYKVKRLAPGRISGIREDQFLFTHDCTTLGGNSGSVVLRVDTGEAIGLHYAGSYLENNFAVPSSTLRSRLASLGRNEILDLGAVVRGDDLEARRPKFTKAHFKNREGYDTEFLREIVELPEIEGELRGNVAPVEGRQDGRLDYTHYSVVMHAERRMAFFTACNIDGGSLFRPKRTKDQWFYDPRLAEEFQIGNELYSGNKLQRGHLVRRLDPVWGETRDEALAAQRDTFFWTNCTPQHEGFNPRSWLELEDYVLENADNDDSLVTVFTGPIFRGTDKKYREVRIPEDFWKVLAFHNDRTGALSATAYRLTQADLMNDLEFVYGAFETYQVPIKEIEALTGLRFGVLSERDPLGQIESQTRIPIHSPGDLIL